VKNVFVFCEVEDGQILDISLELTSKARKLATQLGVKLETVVIGHNLENIEQQLYPYGVDVVHVADDKKLEHFLTLPYAHLVIELFQKEQPQIVLFGASTIGRDMAPRVASALRCGLTADCTSLEIGEHYEKKTDTHYPALLYQIRPAFGGNIIATIINPDMWPQMATVREGVMKKEIHDVAHKGTKNMLDTKLPAELFAVEIIERHVEKSKVNLKNAHIIVAGGYGVGSKENFQLLQELAEVLGADIAGSRAAVDAGFIEHSRQVGQTGVTVRPRLYIAVGISGAVQHRAGMDQSSMIISVNTDPHAPINQIADYTIIGDVAEVIPRMIKYYRKHMK